MSKFLGALALGCGLLVATSGSELQASFVISSQVDGSALAGQSYTSFDNLPLGSAGGTSGGTTVTITGNAAAVQGTLGGSYAAPALSGLNNQYFGTPYTAPDNTTYLSTGTGAVTLAFGGAETYFGILWGSVDSYNTLTFYNGSTIVGTILGSDVMANANGNQSASGTTYVNIFSSLAFTSVVATSASPSFEFDNVAYGVAVPEPSSIVLSGIAGIVGLTVARFRRKRAA